LCATTADKLNMFEWKSEYSVGIGTIDAQHQGLFAMCRDLHEAVRTDRGKSVLWRLLDRLAYYTSAHFAHEERLLRLSLYPGLDKHKAEHAALTGRVMAFQEDLNAGRVDLAVEVLQFLQNWWDTHIMGFDFAYAPHLKARKVA
jgi:hemerythrin